MWCVAWFGTICTIEKNWKTPMEECLKRLLNSSMVGFHVFWIVEMVPNRAKHHQVWIFERSPNVYFLSHYRKVKKKYFQGRYTPWRWGKKWNLMTFFWRCQLKIQNILLVFCNAFGNIENVTQIFRSLN